MNEETLIKIFGKQWFDLLSKYLLSKDFLILGQTIANMRKERTIYPEKEYLFREFRETTPENIKVLFIVNQVIDKYYCHPICCCESYFVNKLMKAWQRELIAEYPELENRFLISGSIDLEDFKYLREQGVFFLNTHLTDDNKLGWYHEDLWKQFIKNVVFNLNKLENLIIVLSGADTWKLEKDLNLNGNTIKIPHITNDEFIGCGIFRKINNKLDKEINW